MFTFERHRESTFRKFLTILIVEHVAECRDEGVRARIFWLRIGHVIDIHLAVVVQDDGEG